MKILVLCAWPQTVIWHRLDLFIDFVKCGYKVVICSSGDEDEWTNKFKPYGFEFRHVDVERNGINFFKDIKAFFDYRRIVRNENPDKILVYQAKAIAYGCWAAYSAGCKEIYTLLTGLGSVFRANTLKSKILRCPMYVLYKHAFKFCKAVIFQNDDDRQLVLKTRLTKMEKTFVVNGSGVDLSLYSFADVPQRPSFLFIGRIVKDKGVCEYLEACRLIKLKYPKIQNVLLGPFDTNPSSLKKTDVEKYVDCGAVEYVGEQKDVIPFLQNCSTYVLPSYHEGTPRSTIEALAIGRAVITTNAPGCKSTVCDGKNGFIVDVKNVEQIVDKMQYLIENPLINIEMGRKSRMLAEEKFDVRIINDDMKKIMDLK